MLALTSPTSGHRSVGIVHSRTKAMEFIIIIIIIIAVFYLVLNITVNWVLFNIYSNLFTKNFLHITKIRPRIWRQYIPPPET
jgi:hypothetical protein